MSAAPHRPPARWRSLVRPVVGIAVLALVLAGVDPAAVGEAVSRIEAARVVLVVAGLTAVHVVMSAAWRAITGLMTGTWLPWRDAIVVGYAAQAIGGVTPANLGGDVHRATLLRRAGHAWPTAVAPLLVQRATSYLALALLALIGLARIATETSVGSGIVAAGATLSIAVGVGAWVLIAPPALLRGPHRRLLRLAGVAGWDRDRLGGMGRAGLVGLGAGIAFHAISIGLTAVLVLAISPAAAVLDVLAALAIARLALAVPLTPSGIGVQEGILALLFVGIGIGGEVAVAAMLVARLGLVVVTLLGVGCLQLGTRWAPIADRAGRPAHRVASGRS